MKRASSLWWHGKWRRESPLNTLQWHHAGSTLDQRRRRWSNIEPAWCGPLVITVSAVINPWTQQPGGGNRFMAGVIPGNDYTGRAEPGQVQRHQSSSNNIFSLHLPAFAHTLCTPAYQQRLPWMSKYSVTSANHTRYYPVTWTWMGGWRGGGEGGGCWTGLGCVFPLEFVLKLDLIWWHLMMFYCVFIDVWSLFCLLTQA